MSTIYTRVSRVADWAGWCSPCQREDRPLVLTRSGPGGLRAWMAGLGDDDRLLLLTCRVCGGWQLVPAREEDDPEVVPEQDLAAEPAPVAVEVREAVVPAPRRAVPRIVTVPESVPAPAFPPQAVAAAAQVLAAARAQTQRTAPRRTERPATARAVRTPSFVSPGLPAVLGLRAGTSQLVLAPAS